MSGFTIGDTCKINVDVLNFAPNFGTNTEKDFGIAIDDSLIADFSGVDLDLSAGSSTDLAMAMHEFVASASTLSIMFVAQLVDDRSYEIDNAALTFVSSGGGGGGVSAVPLPASSLLLIGGVAAFGVLRKPKKT